MFLAKLEIRHAYMFEVTEETQRLVIDLLRRYDPDAKIMTHSKFGRVAVCELGDTYGEFLTKLIGNLK